MLKKINLACWLMFPLMCMAQDGIEHVAIGTYGNPDMMKDSRKIVIQYSDQHNHWQNIVDVPGQSRTIFKTFINDLTATGKNVIAVGTYSNETWVPILLTSADGGKSWRSPERIKGYMTKFKDLDGGLNRLSCQAGFCIAAGLLRDSIDDEPLYIPFIISKDGGYSWSLPKVTVDNEIKDEITQLACHEKSCLAAAHTEGKDYLLNSQNAGVSWQINKTHTKKLRINDIKKVGNTFIAVGYITGHHPQPIVLLSTDGGKTVFTNQQVQWPTNLHFGDLTTLACNQDSCIAGGGYNNGEKHQPLIMMSGDRGLSWQAVTNTNTFPHNMFYTDLQFAGCTSQACMVGGWYDSGGRSLALILTVDTRGTAYTLETSSKNLDQNLELSGVSCTNQGCALTGRMNYLDKEKLDEAELATSNEHLLDWNVTIDPAHQFKKETLNMQKITAIL